MAYCFTPVGMQMDGIPYQREIGTCPLPFFQIVAHAEGLSCILVCQDDVLGRRNEVAVHSKHLEVELVVEFEELQERVRRDDTEGVFSQCVLDEVDRSTCLALLHVEYPNFLGPIGLAGLEEAVVHAAHAAHNAHFAVDEGVVVVGGYTDSVQKVECQVDGFLVFHDAFV